MIERIGAVSGEVNLLVVDPDTERFYRSRRVVIHGAMNDIELVETPRSNPAHSATAAPPASTAGDDNCKYIIIVITDTIRYSTIYYLHWKTDRQATSLIYHMN